MSVRVHRKGFLVTLLAVTYKESCCCFFFSEEFGGGGEQDYLSFFHLISTLMLGNEFKTAY